MLIIGLCTTLLFNAKLHAKAYSYVETSTGLFFYYLEIELLNYFLGFTLQNNSAKQSNN